MLVITLGALELGYSHLTNMMSVLGGVPGIRGFLFNAGVVTTGLLVIAFAVGLQRASRDGSRSKVGVILLILGGIGLGLSGVFACNLGCANVIKEPNSQAICGDPTSCYLILLLWTDLDLQSESGMLIEFDGPLIH